MQNDTIMALRSRIAAIEHGRRGHGNGRATSRALPVGIGAIDRHLPGGGLALGAVHEVAGGGPEVEHGGAAALLTAGLLGRHSGARCCGSWAGTTCSRRPLLQVGFDPGRLVLVQARRGALAAMEEGLRHPDLAGVVCELEGRLDLVASRRLQLAAEASDVLGHRAAAQPALRRSGAGRTHPGPGAAGASPACRRRRRSCP